VSDEAKMLAISTLTLDPRLQFREGTRPDVIEQYAEHPEELPPVGVVLDEDGKYWVYDGFHTVAAHQKAGREKVKCKVVGGDFKDALIAAAGANAAHGLPRTSEDIMRAVRGLLDYEGTRNWSNLSIARAAKVSDKTVEKYRRLWEDEQEQKRKAEARKKPAGSDAPNGKPEAPKKRVSAAGVEYTPTKRTVKPGRQKFDLKQVRRDVGALRRHQDRLYKHLGLTDRGGAVAEDLAYKVMAQHLTDWQARMELMAKKGVPQLQES
jgi:ParB-like chromosome segregation protein Spo0J